MKSIYRYKQKFLKNIVTLGSKHFSGKKIPLHTIAKDESQKHYKRPVGFGFNKIARFLPPKTERIFYYVLDVVM